MSLVIDRIDNIDKKIASRLKQVRSIFHLDRGSLANQIGVEYIDLARYEEAVEPIPASILAIISFKLGVDIEFFFDENAKTDNFLEDIKIQGQIS